MPKIKIPTFFWEHKNHRAPEVDCDVYRLTVSGAVENPFEFSLKELESYLPIAEVHRRFYCVNGWSLASLWRGYRLSDVMDLVKPDPAYEYLRTTSIGGYEDTTPLARLVEGGAMLVTHMDGEPLSLERGKPVRMIIFDLYQFKGVKAVQRLEVVSDYRPGTWEKVGYGDPTIQPYPHKALDLNQEMMPEQHLLSEPELTFEESEQRRKHVREQLRNRRKRGS
jgi:DMSO/TMAO reductase YedYZ molybdopterin-dependent catalytic subunit